MMHMHGDVPALAWVGCAVVLAGLRHPAVPHRHVRGVVVRRGHALHTRPAHGNISRHASDVRTMFDNAY